MALGTVRYFDTGRGFGYIIPDDGSSALTVYRDGIVDSPLSGGLMLGWRVEYEEAGGQNGRGAVADEVCVVEVVIDDDEPEVHEHAMAGPPPDVVME